MKGKFLRFFDETTNHLNRRLIRTHLRLQRPVVDSPRFRASRSRFRRLSAESFVTANHSTGRSGYMGLVFLVVIWLITFISAYFFIAKTWWLPVGASAAAAGIDHHFASTYI